MYTSKFRTTGLNVEGSSIENFFLGDKTMARMLVASCPVETALMLDEFAITLDSPMREAKNFHDAVYSILFYYTYGYLPQPLKKGAYLNPAVVEEESEEIRAYKYALDRFCDTCNAQIFQQLKQTFQSRKRASDIVPRLTASFINPNISGPSIFSRMSRANYPVAMPELLDFVASTMSYRSGWARAGTGSQRGEGMYNVDMSTALRDPGMIVPKMRSQAGGFSADATTFAPWMNSPLQPAKPKSSATKIKNMMERGLGEWSPVVYNVLPSVPDSVAEGSFVSVYMTDDEISKTKKWPEIRRMMTYNGYNSYDDFLKDYFITRDPYIEEFGNEASGFPGLQITTMPLEFLKIYQTTTFDAGMCGSSYGGPARVTDPVFLSGKPFLLPFKCNQEGMWSVEMTTASNLLNYIFDITPKPILRTARNYVVDVQITRQDDDFEINQILEFESAPGRQPLTITVCTVDPQENIKTFAISDYGDDFYTEGDILDELNGYDVSIQIGSVQNVLPPRIMQSYIYARQVVSRDIRTDALEEEERQQFTRLMKIEMREDLAEDLRNIETDLLWDSRKAQRMTFAPLPNNTHPMNNGVKEYYLKYPPAPLGVLHPAWFFYMSLKKPKWSVVRKRAEWRAMKFPEDMLEGMVGFDDQNPPITAMFQYGDFHIERITPLDVGLPNREVVECEKDIEFLISVDTTGKSATNYTPTNREDIKRFAATCETWDENFETASNYKYNKKHQLYAIQSGSVQNQYIIPPNLRDTTTLMLHLKTRDDTEPNGYQLNPIAAYAMKIPVPREWCHATSQRYVRDVTSLTEKDLRISRPYQVPTPLHPDHFPFNPVILSGMGGGRFSPTNLPVEIPVQHTKTRGLKKKFVSRVTGVSYNSKEHTCSLKMQYTPDVFSENTMMTRGTTHLTLDYAIVILRSEPDNYNGGEIFNFIPRLACCRGAGNLTPEVRVDETILRKNAQNSGYMARFAQSVSLVDPYQIYAQDGWTSAYLVGLDGNNIDIQYQIQNRGTGYRVGDTFRILGKDGEDITKNAVGVVTSVTGGGEVLKVELLDEGLGYFAGSTDARGTQFIPDDNRTGAPDGRLKVIMNVRSHRGEISIENSAVPPHQNASCVMERLRRKGFNLNKEYIVSVDRIPVKQLDLGGPNMGSSSKEKTNVPSTRPSAPFVLSSGGVNGFATATMPVPLLFERFSGTSLRNGNAQ